MINLHISEASLEKLTLSLIFSFRCLHVYFLFDHIITLQVLCFEEKKLDSPAKLYVMEVGRDKDAPGGVFRLAPQQIPNAVDAPNDFPVAMQVCDESKIYIPAPLPGESSTEHVVFFMNNRACTSPSTGNILVRY